MARMQGVRGREASLTEAGLTDVARRPGPRLLPSRGVFKRPRPGRQGARGPRAETAHGGTSPTVTGRKKLPPISYRTSTGDGRNPLCQYGGVVMC